MPGFQAEGDIFKDGHVREQGDFWKTMLTFRRCGGVVWISWPSSWMAPWDGCSKPAIMRRVVVFPQPEAKQREELALCDRQVNCVDCNVPLKTLPDVDQLDSGRQLIHPLRSRLQAGGEIFKAWNRATCAASPRADTAPFR